MTIHRTFFFVFLHIPHEMFCFPENLCVNIEHPDVYVKFYFYFFDILYKIIHFS
jgi:hypothetical protein